MAALCHLSSCRSDLADVLKRRKALRPGTRGFAQAAIATALAILTLPGWSADGAAYSAPARSGWWADPLRSEPDVLTQGARQPGGETPLACPPMPSADLPLSLMDAVQLALCGNPRVQQAWVAIKTQAAALGQARSSYLPKLNASVRHLSDTTWAITRTDGGDQTSSTERRGVSTSVTLVWRLLDFGARGSNVEAANDLLAAALAAHDAALQQTMAAVIQAYFDVQAAQASLTGRQKSLEVAGSTFDAARRKETAGPGSTSETLQAQTAKVRATLELVRAEGSLAQAKVVLANAMSVRTDTEIRLPALEAPETPQLGQALGAWLDEAQAQHPSIAAARKQEAAARAQADAVRADGLPSLDVVASYYRNGRPEQGLSGVPTRERQIGVVVNIPLFEGFERTYRVRIAQAQIEQRKAELRDVEQRVAMEVAQGYAAVTAALRGLEESELLLQTATASQASSQRRYAHGVADVLEVLNTQQAQADAQQQRTRSLADWYSARLRMATAVGKLGMEELEKARAGRE